MYFFSLYISLDFWSKFPKLGLHFTVIFSYVKNPTTCYAISLEKLFFLINKEKLTFSIVFGLELVLELL